MKKITLLLIVYVSSILLYSPDLLALTNQAINASDAGKENINIISSFFSTENFVKWFMALAVLILSFVFSRILSHKVVSYIEKNSVDGSWREELSWMVSRTVSVAVLFIWFSISLSIAWVDIWIFMGWIWFWIWFTLKTFLTNFVAWVMMVTQWFYHNGDLVKVDDQIWKIRKINALFTAIEQFDGVVFYVPNIMFMEKRVTNYHTNDKRRTEIDILIDYWSDIHKAKQVTMMVLDKFPNILQAPQRDVIVDQLWDNGILLKVRYWIPSWENYLVTKSNVTETINLALQQQNISFAYPHLTVTHTNFPKTTSL